MIFVTGDTHGDWMSRLHTEAFEEQKDMTKDDYVIICGDFGLWHDTKSERYNLKWLENKPFTTLFLDGNHENFDRLNAYPVETWHGGKVHYISDSVIHLMRGQIFDIEGLKFWTFGGASSHDIRDGILEPGDPKIKEWNKDLTKLFRINKVSWWKEELPTEEEMQEGWNNLEKNKFQVNYILTHSPYTSILRTMDCGSGLYKPDVLTDYLQRVKQNVDFHMWFFGHMHINQMYYWEHSCCIYEQITRIN